MGLLFLLAACQAIAAAAGLPAGLVERARVDLVVVPVTVRGLDGAPVEGLSRRDFVLYDNDEERRIAAFDAGSAPASLVLSFDRSGSMRQFLVPAQAAAIQLVKRLPASVPVSIRAFGAGTERLSDFTLDRDHLYYEINRLRPEDTHTALLADSISAVESLRGRPGPLAAVIFTDGGENTLREGENRTRLADQVLTAARTAGVSIFYVVYGGMGRPEPLETISSGSGGGIISPRGIGDALEGLARRLEAQYTLGLHPARGGRPGEWRTLRVEVLREGATVTARPGYTVPTPEPAETGPGPHPLY